MRRARETWCKRARSHSPGGVGEKPENFPKSSLGWLVLAARRTRCAVLVRHCYGLCVLRNNTHTRHKKKTPARIWVRECARDTEDSRRATGISTNVPTKYDVVADSEHTSRIHSTHVRPPSVRLTGAVLCVCVCADARGGAVARRKFQPNKPALMTRWHSSVCVCV